MNTQQTPADPWAPAREYLVGSFSDEKQINDRLAYAAQHTFLLSPATTCRLIPGCAVTFNLYFVDPTTETHDVGYGKRSLLRTALLKLADAAGISWDPMTSGRMDSMDHPHYVHWHTSGARRSLDGSVLPIHGDCQMDLRSGSDQVSKVLESSKTAEKGQTQLRDMRAKILEHAQSKSQGRAIRTALGIRSYTEAELRGKPFVVARLVFDGRDASDPEMERENKRRIASSMLGGSRALFGAPPAPRGMLPPAPMQAAQLPPVVRQITPDGEILDADFNETTPPPGPIPTAASAPRTPVPPPMQPEAGAPQAPQQTATGPAAPPPPVATTSATSNAAPPPPPPAQPQQSAGASGVKIPGGNEKGTPIESASDDALEYWVKRMEGDLPNKEPRFVHAEEKRIAAFRAEIEQRKTHGGQVSMPGGPMPQGW